MEQKTKKWLVAGALTIAVAIGVGTCYSNTSDKSGRENKEAVASKEDKNKPKEAKAKTKGQEILLSFDNQNERSGWQGI